MLSADIFGKMQSGFNQVIDTLGIPMVYKQTKVPQTVTNIKAGGFKTPGKDDEAIINSLGVGGRIITIKYADLPTPPVKLDRVIVHGETFTVETVHVIDMNGSVLGWKLLCKGR